MKFGLFIIASLQIISFLSFCGIYGAAFTPPQTSHGYRITGDIINVQTLLISLIPLAVFIILQIRLFMLIFKKSG
jgi:hypothetical protein